VGEEEAKQHICAIIRHISVLGEQSRGLSHQQLLRSGITEGTCCCFSFRKLCSIKLVKWFFSAGMPQFTG